MYQLLTFLHSFVRWLVVISLAYAVYRAFKGYIRKAAFTKTDNLVRHWTATIAHIQLVIGMLLYFRSPAIQYFRSHFHEAVRITDIAFFGIYHAGCMLLAIVIITIGSALAKRKKDDKQQFKTLLTWYAIALAIIFIAIPWPFSPFASRPYFR
ncbi:hypothetical protein SAMN05421788_102278 [Filimonas lacunae]|uniref:Uncharacterized protein n=1 Tax=Filimonas lacunae TaxID=477680 RepID=A0A173MI45_9BACT|nr:hypothetical protein [Filimonas lacunae]BAV07091.1 hypothetical protein FLA_3111 [Filimonas lacunae]SIS95118.1 hypothetical protein SAMN05421788_102278 [Filimonas lacunae]